jgi:hypothetical protein
VDLWLRGEKDSQRLRAECPICRELSSSSLNFGGCRTREAVALDPVAETEPGVCSAGALFGGGLGIPIDHGPSASAQVKKDCRPR